MLTRFRGPQCLHTSMAGLAFALFAIIGVSPVPALAQAAAAPSPVQLSVVAQRFFAAVRSNFTVFDRNHDGRLTRQEIEIDMQDPRITGEAAAALAALKVAATRSNYLSVSKTYRLADVDAMEATLQSGQKLAPDVVRYFAIGLKKEAEVPPQPFADGAPHLTAIRQSWTSDCYFLSTVGALAQTDPDSLTRLIRPNSDGTYTVTFPGKRSVQVRPPTDAEIATYSTSTDGFWLVLLEKAYGVVRIADEPKQPFTAEPLDSVGFRTGNPSVVGILTGHAYKEINLPQKTHHPADERLVEAFRGELRGAVAGRRTVMLGNSHHVYAITGYDPATDMVTLHNPYNRSQTESLADGNKLKSTNGFFTVPAPEVVDSFNYVYFELGRPRA